jgi:sugar (pentulose or hexulose) kinase
MFQPYFTPNITMPTARGAVIGFSDAHTRYHLYRAIVEGINYALISGLDTMRKRHGVEFETIAIGGGGSQSDEICQITADMFGLPVERPESYEATGVGSALATYVGMGYYPSYEKAVSEGVRVAKRFEPNARVHDFYRSLYEEIFQKIFPSLSPLYHKLNRLYKTKRPS